MIRQEQMEKQNLQEKVYELYCNQIQITELQKKLRRLKKQTKIQEEDMQEEVERLQEESEDNEEEKDLCKATCSKGRGITEGTISVDIDEYIVYYKEIQKKQHYNEEEMRKYIKENKEECEKNLYEVIQKLKKPQKRVIEKKICIKQKEKNI